MNTRHDARGMVERGSSEAVRTLVARIRRRRRTRGACMVEGAVSIPFFILMLAATVFVGGFYTQRIDAQAQAREQTWLRAVNENCDAGANSSIDGLDIIDSADLGELSKSPLGALCDKGVGQVTYTARRSYTVTGAFSFNKDIEAVASCPCNESPIAGDVAYEAAVEYLWQAYQDMGAVPPTQPTISWFGNILLGLNFTYY